MVSDISKYIKCENEIAEKKLTLGKIKVGSNIQPAITLCLLQNLNSASKWKHRKPEPENYYALKIAILTQSSQNAEQG